MRAARTSRRILLALLGVAAFSGPGLALAQRYPPPPEPSLQQELLDARWPADIVTVGERYLAAYPSGPYAATARAELERARNTRRLLDRSDIRLYRGDFVARGAAPTLYDDVRKAALADKEAAARMAKLYGEGEGANPGRYVGWLQYAAALGNASASYELALYYRKSDQPALAAPYEARAEELGFKPPPTLDNVRK